MVRSSARVVARARSIDSAMRSGFDAREGCEWGRMGKGDDDDDTDDGNEG